MKPETERILRNLGVMARIQANEKLLTQNEFFEIHTPGWRQGATRQWLGENRQNNMTAVAECVRLAKMEITNILSEHADQINQPNQPRNGTVTSEVMIRENLHVCTRIGNALLLGEKGLQNLKITYSDDVALLVQIDEICVDIDNFVNSIAKSVGLTTG